MTTVDSLLDAVVTEVGGTRRDGQHEMANAVAGAMDSGQHLIVQAGTGTGKSLAYLVPAIAHAAAGELGQHRTVIATATLALQRQLVDHDLPSAVTALSRLLPRTVTFAVSKGRHNYVCLDKFNRDATVAREEDDDSALFAVPTSALGRQAKKLRDWVAATATGDRDDVPFEIDHRLWRSVTVSGRECVGAAKCLYGERCFAEAARAKASNADIVVTNHALLVIDVIEGIPVLPEHDVVVVDEAHELGDRTTNALAGAIDATVVERAARVARKFVDPASYDRLLDSAANLSAALEAQVTPGQAVRIEDATGLLHGALTMLRDAGRACLTSISSSATDEPEVVAAKKRAKADVQDVVNHAAALLGIDDDTVAWLADGRPPAAHYAPLSVAGHLGDALFARSTVVLTSATLQVSGSMSGVAASLGMPKHRELDVGSPFDYARQAILYCNPMLPPPGPQGIGLEALDELADLIDAAGGRTLALFSSWRGVERAAEHVAARFAGRADRPLIVAKRGDAIPELVAAFKSQPTSTLLGTVSLWQGIDVPGDTCTLVAIDRLPFPRPDDPVMAARAARVDAAGGNGFTSVHVPRAALLLAQGVGRLIRSTQDRGVVAVLDSRLATKGYGRTLRQSLPPLWYTNDTELVKESLRNLNRRAYGN